MPIRQRFDRLLLGATMLQTAIGLAILASASWLIATERYGRPGSYFFTWQAATAMIGLGVLVVCMHLRSTLLTDRRLIVGAVVAGWVLLVAAFGQAPVAATHRWISIGGISLQPSVVVRLALDSVGGGSSRRGASRALAAAPAGDSGRRLHRHYRGDCPATRPRVGGPLAGRFGGNGLCLRDAPSAPRDAGGEPERPP